MDCHNAVCVGKHSLFHSSDSQFTEVKHYPVLFVFVSSALLLTLITHFSLLLAADSGKTHTDSYKSSRECKHAALCPVADRLTPPDSGDTHLFSRQVKTNASIHLQMRFGSDLTADDCCCSIELFLTLSSSSSVTHHFPFWFCLPLMLPAH